MPDFGAVILIPGVNVEQTPTANKAGYSVSQLGRFKNALFQKLGGWTKYTTGSFSGVPRDLHAWQDLNDTVHVGVGTTRELAIVTGGVITDVTPQTLTTNPAVSFTTTSSSTTVGVADAGITTVTPFDSVFFNTPISVGGIVLSGLYPINASTGVGSYNIIAHSAATSSVAGGGAVPSFTTINASSVVTVTFNNHGLSVGDVFVFPISTTVGGVTIMGSYPAVTVPTANTFTIQVSTPATSGTTASMNSGNAQLLYYIALGPAAGGSGYGLGGYGDGGFGTGVVPTSQTGTPITATDWTQDNFGEILVACPEGGGVYYYNPGGGFSTAQLISQAPVFNAGIFVSTTSQILIAYGSTITEGVGVQQDPLLVQWSDSENIFDWTPSATNFAGNYHIPIGSVIRGGMAFANNNLIWTDLDLWAMNFIGGQGGQETFGFNQIGVGAGLASSHAAQRFRDAVYWMGSSNFYVYNGGGVAVIPCPVWDAVFQNLNTTYIENVRAMPNTPFNEVGWLYPSLASVNGECDSYVKMNVSEPNQPWDYGTLARSAWCDQSVAGPPLGATPQGILYQHETTNDADSQPLVSSFTTGYFFLGEGEEFCYVDQILPDFKFGTYAGAASAQIQISFNVINYPGDTPTTYGPYTVTASTKYIAVRFRARQMSITVQSSDTGSFWRIGRIRYRWSPAGRR